MFFVDFLSSVSNYKKTFISVLGFAKVRAIGLKHERLTSLLISICTTSAPGLGYKIRPYPAHLSNLTPMVLPFSRMTIPLGGSLFQDDDEATIVVERFLKSEHDVYSNGTRQLVHRWNNCATLYATYLEND